MSEIIYKELDKKTLKELHDTELEILKEIHRVCKKLNIKYFLMGGTLLGAVRHNGFIPWDDDLDIGMTREDYNIFIRDGVKEIKDDYFIHCRETDSEYWLPFVKVRKNNTTFLETLLKDAKVNHNGIFVDVFPIDYANKLYFINYFRAFVVKSIEDVVLVKKKIVLLSNSRHPKLNRILMLFNIDLLYKIQDFFSVFIGRKKRNKMLCLVGAYHIKKDIYMYDDMFPLVEMKFEGFSSYSFKNFDKYLTNLYGDYMKLPKKEDRVNHGAIYVSFKEGSCLISRDEVDKK